MLIQYCQNIVDDRVFGFGEQVRLRKGRIRDLRGDSCGGTQR